MPFSSVIKDCLLILFNVGGRRSPCNTSRLWVLLLDHSHFVGSMGVLCGRDPRECCREEDGRMTALGIYGSRREAVCRLPAWGLHFPVSRNVLLSRLASPWWLGTAKAHAEAVTTVRHINCLFTGLLRPRMCAYHKLYFVLFFYNVTLRHFHWDFGFVFYHLIWHDFFSVTGIWNLRR